MFFEDIEITPLARRDWFEVRSWVPIHARFGLAPGLPGVTPIAGRSEVAPWPFQVHRSHLPQLGIRLPASTLEMHAELTAVPVVLRAHQQTAIAFVRERRGTLLADEPRVGKSAAAMFAHNPSDGTCVVVGPVAARLVWHEWAARRFGGCAASINGNCATCARFGIGGHVATRPSFLAVLKREFTPEKLTALNPHVIFMSLALLPYWESLFAHMTIGTLIVDEAHLAGIQNSRGGDYDSQTVTAWRKLSTVSHRLLALTGTPLLNKPKSLWALLNVLAPTAFGGFRQFGERYCNPQYGAHGTSYDGASNVAELRLRLSEIMLRRTWAEIRTDLPAISRSTELVDLPVATVNAVMALADRIKRGLGNTQTAVGDLARLRSLFAPYKIPRAVELAREITAMGHSVVLWTWHKDVAKALCEALRADKAALRVFGPIHGGVASIERDRIQTGARGAHPAVLVATMGSLATAVDLSFCSHEVFVELEYTPTNMAQAEMRPYNGVQSVASIYLVADCEPDRRLIENVLPKLEMQKALGVDAGVGDAAAVLRGTFGVIGDDHSLATLAEAVALNAEGFW